MNTSEDGKIEDLGQTTEAVTKQAEEPAGDAVKPVGAQPVDASPEQPVQDTPVEEKPDEPLEDAHGES